MAADEDDADQVLVDDGFSAAEAARAEVEGDLDALLEVADDEDAEEELFVAGAPTRLTDSQVEEITTLLKAGKRLPPHLFPHLFESPREYQLAYRGKARAVDILADTMAVPLQPVRTVGDANGAWR